jgi:hypothetical protein
MSAELYTEDERFECALVAEENEKTGEEGEPGV